MKFHVNHSKLFSKVLSLSILAILSAGESALGKQMSHFENSSASRFSTSSETRKQPKDGISFLCSPSELKKIEIEAKTYFIQIGLNPSLFTANLSDSNHSLNFSLNTPSDDTNTLDLFQRPEFEISYEIISLPTNQKNVFRNIKTVSKKEIAYALMQHGRHTVFSGENCKSDALIDQIGIRQNTVAWAQELSWGWPNGDGAKFNPKYWPDDKLVSDYPLAEVFRDAFLNQSEYSMGCFSATKLTMAHGILDYYDRIKKDPTAVKKITQRLMSQAKEGNGPLRNVEPGEMWFFEENMIYENGKLVAFNNNLTKKQLAEFHRPGKILQLQKGIAGKNFVPGDWSYYLNPHQESYGKTGYEGSNSIYLGRDKFDDYYADQFDDKTKEFKNYTFKEKLDEVHQWENGVFSRSRDWEKIKKLSSQQLEQLTRTPLEGGLLLDYRVGPMLF